MSTPVPAGALAALAVTSGPRSGEALPLARPVVTLGRGTGCDLVIDDDSVSAQHARLEWADGGWRITDLGSVNGTAVDGVKLSPDAASPLPFGSTLRLGGVRLQFQEVGGADPAAARAEYVPPAAPTTLRQERRGTRFPLWLVLLVLVLLAVAGYLLTSGPAVLGSSAPAAPSSLAPLTLRP
jgi:pSer/pThr/pTyr-binding forkhead associated (FHA) protein